MTVKHKTPSSFRLDDPGSWPVVVPFFLYPKTLGGAHFVPFRPLLVIAMVFFTIQLMLDGYDAWIAQYLHCLNLPVHETGHLVFSIFGNRVLHSLGGSLFQIIMLLVFCFALWIKPRDILDASVAPVPKPLMVFMTGILFCLKWDCCSSTIRLQTPCIPQAMWECGFACCGVPGACSTTGFTSGITIRYYCWFSLVFCFHIKAPFTVGVLILNIL